VIRYRGGEEYGHWTRWGPNGTKREEGEYEGRGKIQPKGEAEAKPVGLYTAWYDSGSLKLQGRYADGVRDGTWIDWYPNGRKSAETLYSAGRRNGSCKTWYENGQVASEATFRDGKEEGASFTWSPLGIKTAEENYRGGVRDGTSTWWDDHGKLSQIQQWESGRLVKVR
jgi:antitoxin component YwqK of YwqJK toxin-antitoxin module